MSDLPAGLDPDRIPRHVAIIMDGNRRWAKSHSLAAVTGHNTGVKSTRDIVRACNDMGVECLTLYSFSTENWRRGRAETSAVLRLIETSLNRELDELDSENVRVHHVGDPGPLPRSLKLSLQRAMERTADNTGMILNLAVNYGGRDELVHAARTIASQVARGELTPEGVDADALDRCLYTTGQPELDLLIRTGGEFRLSNFLLWQAAYAEFWFTSTLWPDFTPQELHQAIADYQSRERRFGGVLSEAG